MGHFLMFLTVGVTLVGLAAAGYVGYIRLDSYHLLSNELNLTGYFDSMLINILSFVLAIHEGQILAVVVRGLSIPLFFEAVTRMRLLYMLGKMPLSISRIRLYTEMRMGTAIILDLEKTATGFLLGAVFWFVLFGTGTLYVGIQKHDISLAIPALAIACMAVAFVQIVFLCGCSFNKFSLIILNRWKKDKTLCTQGKECRAHLKRLLKSLPPISMPAGTVGIIDKEIKMNYMDSLLQNIVNTVLTLKDIIK